MNQNDRLEGDQDLFRDEKRDTIKRLLAYAFLPRAFITAMVLKAVALQKKKIEISFGDA